MIREAICNVVRIGFEGGNTPPEGTVPIYDVRLLIDDVNRLDNISLSLNVIGSDINYFSLGTRVKVTIESNEITKEIGDFHTGDESISIMNPGWTHTCTGTAQKIKHTEKCSCPECNPISKKPVILCRHHAFFKASPYCDCPDDCPCFSARCLVPDVFFSNIGSG